METIVPDDLNIEASGIVKVKGRVEKRNMPRNNEKQDEALRKALTGQFTIIQGPPGGKCQLDNNTLP